MYTEDNLISLADYLMKAARELERTQEQQQAAPVVPSMTDTEPVDHVHNMRKLARQIEVIDYNPTLFEDILNEYDVHCGPIDEPLEEMPLHINDDDLTSQAVVKWRLENGV